MGNKMVLDIEFDGQVDRTDLEKVAEQAVVVLSDVVKVVATLPDGPDTAWAESDFTDDGTGLVVSSHGRNWL
jgi:hypothetical protein